MAKKKTKSVSKKSAGTVAKKAAKRATPKSKTLPKKKPSVTKAVSKKVAAKAKKPGSAPKAAARPAKKAAVTVKRTASKPEKKGPPKKLNAATIREFRQVLLNLRDKAVDGITFLTGDTLNRSQRDASGDLSGYSLHMADQGTDNFDREFALNLASSGQDVLYEIDAAIRRCDAGTYGLCEMTGEPIEIERLKTIPYARYSIAAQKEIEKGRTRYRPFGLTLGQGG